MEIEAFLICDAATDSQGKLNVLGSFDTIYTKEIPAIHPSCAIVVRLRLAPSEVGDHELVINFTDKAGKEVVHPFKVKVDVIPEIPEKPSRINVIMNLQRLKFENFGEFLISLSVDGKPFSTMPIYVSELKQLLSN